MRVERQLYFHSPCFDGIVSAVLLWEHLRSTAGWDQVGLRPTNYNLNSSWLRSKLPVGSAVVDFLFHPAAEFWFDHHATAFPSPNSQRKYEQGRGRHVWMYDPKSPACASVIWSWAQGQPTSPLNEESNRLRELVGWAEKIDAAQYGSVEEVRDAKAPALRIAAALTLDRGSVLSTMLVRELRSRSLHDVAATAQVERLFTIFRVKASEGLVRLRRSASLVDEVVVFDVDVEDAIVDRFAPYFLFPNARASVGLARSKNRIVLRAMRNPWRSAPHPHLGNIARLFGGGGHERIGSVVFKPSEGGRASEALEAFVSALVAAEQ